MSKPADGSIAGPLAAHRTSFVLALAATGCFIVGGSADASDYCKSPGPRFKFSDPPSVYPRAFIVKSGKKCTKRFTFGGNTIFKNLAYQVDARYGKVEIFPNGVAIYRAKAGYHGPDSFTLRLCGAASGRDGCADLEFSVTVE